MASSIIENKKIISADREIGKWKILKKIQPDIVAIGYDQTLLRKSLESSVQEYVGARESGKNQEIS